MVNDYLSTITLPERQALETQIKEYMQFREEVSGYLTDNFGGICTRKCYENKLSACCSKEGIITFFADIVVNALVSTNDEIKKLMAALENPSTNNKCVYLRENGCVWRAKPIVCEMFLCDKAKNEVFEKISQVELIWKKLRKRAKLFKWPDRPVLFDDLEKYFMDKGFSSPLMYLHNSPGLLRVKKIAELKVL